VGGPLQTLFGNAPPAPIFYIGLGDQFDGDKLKAYPPGSLSFCRTLSKSAIAPNKHTRDWRKVLKLMARMGHASR
jgi:hypothetical protein